MELRLRCGSLVVTCHSWKIKEYGTCSGYDQGFVNMLSSYLTTSPPLRNSQSKQASFSGLRIRHAADTQ